MIADMVRKVGTRFRNYERRYSITSAQVAGRKIVERIPDLSILAYYVNVVMIPSKISEIAVSRSSL
jgi:hypothetical protein